MQNGSRSIIVTGIAIGCISVLYFASLICHLPFAITLALIGASLWLLYRSIARFLPAVAEENRTAPVISIVLLAAGIGVITWKSYSTGSKYGEWDAWCMWNFHAKYLADGDLWQRMFLNQKADHTDYPLLLPGTVGFLIRLCNGRLTLMIPFIFSLLMTLFIPVLLYLESPGRYKIAGTIALFVLGTNTYYVTNGLTQYADVVLAFFFLCAVICAEHARVDSRYTLLAAACLGCCIWTKNEGLILAGIFMVFNSRLLLANAKHTAIGLSAFAVIYVIFKLAYAPANDMVAGQNHDTLNQLFVPLRYKVIYKHLTDNIDKNFYYLKIVIPLYLLLCMVKRQWPGRQFMMLTCCGVAYFFVYVLSVQDLEWHLTTSQDRLILQLMPALLYVAALQTKDLLPLRFEQKTR